MLSDPSSYKHLITYNCQINPANINFINGHALVLFMGIIKASGYRRETTACNP